MIKNDLFEKELIAAAKELLAQEGYEAFAMRTLAHKCDVAVGTLYNYYPTKHALVATIMQQQSDKLIEQIDCEMERFSTPIEKLMAIYHSLYEAYHSAHKLWIEKMRDFVKELDKTTTNQMHSTFSSAIKSRVQLAVGREEDAQTDVFLGAVWRLLFAYCVIPSASEQDVKQILELILVKMEE